MILGVLIGLAHIPLVLADAQTISYKSVIGGREEEREALLCMPMKSGDTIPVSFLTVISTAAEGWRTKKVDKN